MKTLSGLLIAMLLVGPVAPAGADEARLTFGGDHYAAGQTTSIATPVDRDAFIIGSDVTLAGPVAGDAHIAGFDVNSGATIAGDLYAAGFSVSVAGGVGGDVTAAGNSVTLRSAAPVGGNVRLAGAHLTIATPVGGSALVTGQSLTLDAAISGDFSFFGETLTFGPGARVDGTLAIRAPSQIAVPASVAPAERVRFELLVAPDYVSEAGRTAGNVANRFWPVFWSVVGWWLLLALAGAALIALLPRTTRALETVSERHPFRNLGLGILSFAAVLGLVPVVALTVIGLLLLPFVLIFVVLACSLAYVTGAFLIGLRIARGFLTIDSNVKRLGVMVVALITAGLLGMIPFAGWLLSLTIAIFGFGTATVLLMTRWTPRDAGSTGTAAIAPVASVGTM